MPGPERPDPRDHGLQNERTGLAWQRTMLSGLGGGLVVARLLSDFSPVLAVLTGVLSLAVTVTFGWVALRLFRERAGALVVGGRIGDGRPAALAALLLALTGLGAVGYVLLA